MTYSITYRSISILMIFLLVFTQIVSIFDEVNAGVKVKISAKPMSNLQNNVMQNRVNNNFISGDGIMIDTFPDTTSFLNRTFAIDDNGMVDFPMVGKIKVTDMTVKQLEDLLKAQFKSYLRSPSLVVKPVIRISVLGGIFRPGLYYVDYDNSLWSVIHQVGGTISEDGIKEMKLERNSEVVCENLVPFFEKGASLRNIGIKSGDQIWIPSPNRPTFWQQLGDILPLATFVTSLVMLYVTYQQQMLIARLR